MNKTALLPNYWKLAVAFLCIGIFAGWGLSHVMRQPMEQVDSAQSDTKQPLYWVAPMDPNYRRDKPGKSPMGMDLIPVYERDDTGEQHQDGIQISPQLQQNFSVRTYVASPRELNQSIDVFGVVQYDEDYLVHVHTRVEGWIEKLHINAVGDEVIAGQALFDIYSPTLVNAQEELLLAIQQGNKNLMRAAKQRLKTLQVTDAFIARLIRTKRIQQTITRVASQAGVISHLSIREGFYVKPDKTLMAIAALAPIWVVADVPLREVAKLSLGMPAQLLSLDHLNIPQVIEEGVVEYIYPTLEKTSQTQKVRVRFSNQHRSLQPNRYVELKFMAEPKWVDIAVPKQAIIYRDNQQLLVIRDERNTFYTVQVITGVSDDGFIEITRGIEAGMQVVISAQFLIDSASHTITDLQRWQPDSMTLPNNENTVVDEAVNTARVTGVVREISTNGAVIFRDAIPKWHREATEVYFDVQQISTSLTSPLQVGTHLDFTFQVTDNGFVVTKIHHLHHPTQPKPLPEVEGHTHD